MKNFNIRCWEFHNEFGIGPQDNEGQIEENTEKIRLFLESGRELRDRARFLVSNFEPLQLLILP